MTNTRGLMFVALLTVIASGSMLAQATNDGLEPNNSAGNASTLFFGHTTNAFMGGLSFTVGTGGNTTNNVEQLVITAGDTDWFQIGGQAGNLNVYLNQTGFAAFPLDIEILDATQTVVAGSTAGGHRVLAVNGSGTSGTPDPYDGVAVTATTTAGNTFFVRVFYPTGGTAIPGTVSVPYELTYEWDTTPGMDSSEGLYSNNFLAYSATDATPSPVGSTTSLTSRVWSGYDYYSVTLANPGTITVDLSNFNTANSLNFDVYWVATNGGVFSASPAPNALPGAEDTWPNGFGAGIAAVGTANTTEQIVTPTLSPGTYYFQVVAWDLSGIGGGQVGFYFNAGNYDIDFTTSQTSDDAFEENDTAQTASTITTSSSLNNLKLFFGAGEEDWYKINVTNGQNLQVTMTLDAPATDDLNMELYQPNGTLVGQQSDVIDRAIVPNTDTATKGQATATEYVGTWGAVGTMGNTNLTDGEYYIRVFPANVPQDGGYSLNVITNGTRSIGPEDGAEPNNSQTDAINGTTNRVNRGLTTGWKLRDSVDIYKFAASSGDNIEVTLLYDADANTDIDLILFDLDWPTFTGFSSFLGTPNFANENGTANRVQVSGTAGDSYVAAGQTAPGNGDIFVIVQRWGSYGQEYSLNVNVNGQTPLPNLQVNTITTQASVTAGTSFNVNIEVENVGGSAQSVDTIMLMFDHSAGANVSSEYTVTGPTNATLPDSVGVGATTVYTMSVLADPLATNGSILITADVRTGNNLVPGTPSASFTLAGGVAPLPELIYQSITGNSDAEPGGVLTLSVTVFNQGRINGSFEDNTLSFVFRDSSNNDVSGFFSRVAGSNPSLPAIVNVNQALVVRFTFGISASVTPGAFSVEVSGGGGDNPTTAGVGNIAVTIQIKKKGGGGGGGCAAADTTTAPVWALLLLASLASGAWVTRRRKA